MIDLLAPANFSEDRRHRYSLCRRLSIFSSRPLVSCGYNPSRAAEIDNDNTIRREISLAGRIGCGVLVKVNAFAGVATDPNDLALMEDPVGQRSDEAIRAAIELCRQYDGILLACWGVPKGKAATRRLAMGRFREVAALTDSWTALRITKSGHPEHPLYLPGALEPQPWAGYEVAA